MFVADNVSVIRAGRPLVANVSLSLSPGVFTVVIGPNGAGKSTLLKVMTGEIAADRGIVTCHGRPLGELSAVELAADRAVLPQSTTLSFPFTALEVVRMGAIAHGSLDPTRAARAALARACWRSVSSVFRAAPNVSAVTASAPPAASSAA